MFTLQNFKNQNMNRIIKFRTLFFVIFLTICSAYAQEDKKEVTITSSGSGKTLEDANQAALRSATEQAFGVFISSKTEMFNDQVVADEMASVSSGNIKSYEIIYQVQLPDGRWGVTLKAIVSLDKLTSFVQAKGESIEFKGGMFALNIKQQKLNEQGEIKAITEMIGLLHEFMQISFDYVIKSSDPISLDTESKNWKIPIDVTATCNKNIDFCANYFMKTLSALTLSEAEVETYKTLYKEVFTVNVNFNGQSSVYYLRKKSSISTIISLISNWEGYTRLFAVLSGIDESYGNGLSKLFIFSSSKDGYYDESPVKINFPSNGQQAATFSWNDKRTLAQIEQMTGYSVKPRGIVSQIKNGGYVVYEKNGHGIVMTLIDVGGNNWPEAKKTCDELVLNGYNDWRLPSKEEIEYFNNNLYKRNLIFGVISGTRYWSSTNDPNSYFDDRFYSIEFGAYESNASTEYGHEFNIVRAVRAF